VKGIMGEKGNGEREGKERVKGRGSGGEGVTQLGPTLVYATPLLQHQADSGDGVLGEGEASPHSTSSGVWESAVRSVSRIWDGPRPLSDLYCGRRNCVSACLSVCSPAYLKKHVHQILCTSSCLWLWLGSPLTTAITNSYSCLSCLSTRKGSPVKMAYL